MDALGRGKNPTRTRLTARLNNCIVNNMQLGSVVCKPQIKQGLTQTLNNCIISSCVRDLVVLEQVAKKQQVDSAVER